MIRLFQLFHTILNNRWAVIISTLLCISVTAIAMHTFSVKSYSSSTLLGLATGLGAVAAIWLGYSLVRPRKFR